MEHQVKWTKRYLKDRDRCAKRGYDLKELDKVVQILQTRKFTPEEVVMYKPHYLDRYKTNELHIGGRKSDWILTYHLDNGVLYLERTGSHDDIMGSLELDPELVLI
jgi:mRNA interferase YafQ